jgi:hypothetical protein
MPRAQWCYVRPRVSHAHNHKINLGNAGLFFKIAIALAFALLYALRDKIM